MNMVKRQLEIVTAFSKDIGMKFGEEKRTYKKIFAAKHQPSNNSSSC